jgi:hypothetical protein
MVNIPQELIDFAVETGIVLFAALGALYMVSVRLKPEIWVTEYSGTPAEGDPKRIRVVVFLGMGTLLLLILTQADLTILRASPEYAQTNLFIANLFSFTVYNVLDLLIIRWLMHIKLHPPFMEIPRSPGSKSFMVHFGIFFRNYIYAGVLSFLASIIATGM